MNHSSLIQKTSRKFLYDGIIEDGWPWDWTTRGCLGETNPAVTSRVITKSNGVWAGESLALALPAILMKLGGEIKIISNTPDGSNVRRGQTIAAWTTTARFALAVERPYLNLAAYMSGIATQTYALVQEVQKSWRRLPRESKKEAAANFWRPPRVTSTRKTLPGYRDLALHAVLTGGGFCHRLNLASGVLIKENHIASAGGIKNALVAIAASTPHPFRPEIEVQNLNELVAALDAGVESVLLDNFKPREVRAALGIIKKRNRSIIVEVSGGINIENVSQYVLAGVTILSSGSLTHSVKAMDLSLQIEREPS